MRRHIDCLDALAAGAMPAELLRVAADACLQYEPEQSNVIHIEWVEDKALIGYQTAWADLCGRTIEPNIFLEPAFALPLLQHVRYPRRPRFLLVWEESGPASFGRLLGLFPFDVRRGWRGDRIARGFAHKQTSSGTPLIDRDRAVETLEAVLTWFGLQDAGIDALAFRNIATDGPFHTVLQGVCAMSSRSLVGLDGHVRAMLRPPKDGDKVPILFASAKRRKERVRQFRRLSEAGTRTYVSARTPGEIASATERFLALEHNGWKGARGTALLAEPTLATFARTMTRLMAHEGKCRIDAIEIDGKPVAMGIIITVGNKAYFWKTAFDEAYASLSPGVQFTIELTRTQLADPTLALTDSCAVADHPMIDRLWPERLAITDLILAVAPGKTRRFARTLRFERLRRAARRQAKALWHRMRHRGGN